MYRKSSIYRVGLVLPTISVILWGSWNTYLTDKRRLSYVIFTFDFLSVNILKPQLTIVTIIVLPARWD